MTEVDHERSDGEDTVLGGGGVKDSSKKEGVIAGWQDMV